MKRSVGVGLLLIVGVAAACTIAALVTAPVEVSAAQHISETWEEIGDELGQRYGAYGKDTEMTVKIPVSVCFGVCAPPAETNMLKPCGMTLKEAAYGVAETARLTDSGGGGDGGYAGGGGDWGGGGDPYEYCSAVTYKSCATQGDQDLGCSYQTVLECPEGLG